MLIAGAKMFACPGHVACASAGIVGLRKLTRVLGQGGSWVRSGS